MTTGIIPDGLLRTLVCRKGRSGMIFNSEQIELLKSWAATAAPEDIISRIHFWVTTGDTCGMHWSCRGDRERSGLLLCIQEMVCAHVDAKTLASS